MAGGNHRRLTACTVAGLLFVTACSGGDAPPTSTTVLEADAADESAVSTTDAPDTSAGEPEPEALGIAGRGHAAEVEALLALLPATTRGAAAIDVARLASDGRIDALIAFSQPDRPEIALSEPFEVFGVLDRQTGLAELATTVVLGYPTDPSMGVVALAAVSDTADDGREVGVTTETADGRASVLLPGGILVVGPPDAVQAVLDVQDGESSVADSAFAPFLAGLDAAAPLGFVHAMPAFVNDSLGDRRSLDAATAVSGAFDLVDGELAGDLEFHMADAARFVESFNALNAPSTDGAEPLEAPLTAAAPLVGGLERVVVPIGAERGEAFDNRFKKLIAGMTAHDYAEGVSATGNDAWLDFVVLSEAEPLDPPSPGSVYIRWEFKDQAAIEAFERNELPAGFRLAPTRFLESDDPAGEYFFALNLYDAGGGSIVGGARAEWDVFVHGPDGADPNAGERPRFAVVDVAAEEVSADAGNLLTPAEPVSHELIDGDVVSSVKRLTDDGAVEVFRSSFPVPDPATAEVARFTREMAIGNDYIYWAHGVSDRVLYNATTFNHDSYFVDVSQLDWVHDTRWVEYLQPEVKDAVYYVNTLEYVASPMANLDSEFLDITPEWLDELVAFTTNGHQIGLMRAAVEQLFRGAADPFVERNIANDVPATFYHFAVTDPAGLEAALDLPPDRRLAPITLFDGGEAAHLLTLSVYEYEGSLEATRAEWSVYVDHGDGRPPRRTIVDLLTADVGFDPVGIIGLPDLVAHDLAGDTLSTVLRSPSISFAATIDASSTTTQPLALDWIEAGDSVCHRNGVCDRFYYDAETLDVPVRVATDLTLSKLSTPWNEYIDTNAAVVFFRDNAQQYAIKPWYNLDVPVPELPFDGLDDPTHTIGGSGTLVGRDSDVADSTYEYTGDARLDGDLLTFALDQRVENSLGVGNIFTTGSFDVTTGSGTQTVVDCQGPSLLCSDIENGATSFLSVDAVEVADDGVVSWMVDVVVDLGGSFGTADSASTLTATPST